MSTIQEAYRGVLERGEEWRLSYWTDGQRLICDKDNLCIQYGNNVVRSLFSPSKAEALSDKWERVPPPTPRPTYLMLPCEKGKGMYCLDEEGDFSWSGRHKYSDYRQVAFPLTVESVERIWEQCQYDSSSVIQQLSELLRLMKEVK